MPVGRQRRDEAARVPVDDRRVAREPEGDDPQLRRRDDLPARVGREHALGVLGELDAVRDRPLEGIDAMDLERQPELHRAELARD